MKPEGIAARAEDVTESIHARGSQLRFEYAGVSTAYCSDDRASGEWLRQFFEGYFISSGAREVDASVYSTDDPALFTALQEVTSRRPVAGDPDHPEVPITDSVTLIPKRVGKLAPPEDVHLLLFEEQRRIVLVTSGNPEVRRGEGMQTLRAVNKWLMLERGWIPLHSACAAKNGRTICVTGQKGSGKTSTLLNLLARNGCDLVAADKFLVRDGGSHVEVCGLPGKIGVRVGTTVAQPKLLDWLAEPTGHFFPHLSLEEVRRIVATNSPERLRTRSEKIHMTPAELAGLFGGSVTRTAPLGLVLIPFFDLDVAKTRLAPVDPAQASRILTECHVRLLSKGEGFLLHFFDLSDALLAERLAALLDKHLPEVPSYEVRQNHRTNEMTAELVAGLL